MADDRPLARSLARLYGTYAYTCPREFTTGFTFENTPWPEIRSRRAVIDSLGAPNERTSREKEVYPEVERASERALALARDNYPF